MKTGEYKTLFHIEDEKKYKILQTVYTEEGIYCQWYYEDVEMSADFTEYTLHDYWDRFYYVPYDGSGAKDAAAYNQMGICLMKQEKYAEALEIIGAGQKLSDPLHGKQLWFNEVVIFEKMGEFNTAYEKAVAYRNKYPEDTKIRTELEFLATRIREES